MSYGCAYCVLTHARCLLMQISSVVLTHSSIVLISNQSNESVARSARRAYRVMHSGFDTLFVSVHNLFWLLSHYGLQIQLLPLLPKVQV